MKQLIFNHLKNIPGWRTNRKLVVISVDDYGNVRLDSKKAREKMDAAGLKVHSRFDAYDTLETKDDLESLYNVLTSVKDHKGSHAVFTPFALPCNINFEGMRSNGYQEYVYETLPETYSKLVSRNSQNYEGAWSLWKEGIAKGIMVPQFHGREHLNLKVLETKMKAKDSELLTALENNSYTSLTNSGYPNISYTAAFEFEEISENSNFKDIIADGLDRFEEVYGYRSPHFNPPGGREHPAIHPFLIENGVRFLDTPFLKNQHEGDGKYSKILNWTGKTNSLGQIFQVRNVVFEPTDNRGFDWVDYSLKQVETAFKWNRPAIISSHRVNFCGLIDPTNRAKGLEALGLLLRKIVEKWPNVEFVSSVDLGEIISGNDNV